MSDIHTGGGGSIGGGVDTGEFVGRDRVAPNQSIKIDLGSRTPQELQRVVDIVLGDGFRWDGVVREIRKLEESLTTQMSTMEQRLEKRIEGLESKLGRTPQSDVDRKFLIAIMAGLFFLTVIVAWGVYVLANGGIA